MTIITTNRLYLRQFTPNDAIHFYTMNLDNEVMQYTGDIPFESVEAAKTFLENYNPYEKYGMGRWAVCLKENDDVLGWCGLKFHPNKNYVEVGYRFYKRHWGKGYATESALASINYGFKTLKLKTIYAHAHIGNLASHRVLEKCGLTHFKNGTYDGMPAKLYKIENPYITVKTITASDTIALRHSELRQGMPIDACHFEGDTNENTFHIGVCFNTTIVCVATYMKNNNSNFKQQQHYQLRGMATTKTFQGLGFGKLALQKGEALLKKRNVNLVWCNARKGALGFYKKNGFSIFGNEFDIPTAGAHYVMYKQLK